ncbi:unnamed protein product [Linum trigynum]|uniref:Zinc knuckle CX2CX4HX4C domain-containing protein n=1 Tax=Linum trigynum TaxID=586398 RepID=A0AAV2E916_9ROSI
MRLYSMVDEEQYFAKVKATIDIEKPLRSWLQASHPALGNFRVEIVYECLPLFCYKCGRIGNDEQHCRFSPPHSGVENYGPHMMTEIFGNRLYDRTLLPSNPPATRGTKQAWGSSPRPNQCRSSTVWLNPNLVAGSGGEHGKASGDHD